VERLSSFLESEEAEELPEAELGSLRHLLHRAKATLSGDPDGHGRVWADPFTVEEMTSFALLGFVTTASFWAAWSEDGLDDLLLLALTSSEPAAQVAAGAGYVAGIAARVVHTVVTS